MWIVIFYNLQRQTVFYLSVPSCARRTEFLPLIGADLITHTTALTQDESFVCIMWIVIFYSPPRVRVHQSFTSNQSRPYNAHYCSYARLNFRLPRVDCNFLQSRTRPSAALSH